jgi:leader peptidase (prepilin peptidase)/N-methyltransferase
MEGTIPWPGPWLALIVAPVVGSFMATAVERLPQGRSLRGRSHCPHCGAQLAVRDLVPIISWLALRGRCRACDASLSRQYPLTEIAAVAIASLALLVASDGTVWALCLVGWFLWVAALFDQRHFLLPDTVTLPLAGAGLIWSALQGEARFVDGAVGAAAGYAVLAGIGWLYRRWRGRDGIGLGDAKLLAAAGAWLGWTRLPELVVLAGTLALAALLIRRLKGEPVGAQTAVAFGSFLAGAFWCVALAGGIA